MTTRFILFFVLISFGVGRSIAQHYPTEQIDISPLISRVINRNGLGLDSLYNEYISKSSPYYGDFYGLQVIQNVGREDIRKDFKVVSETDSSITIMAGEDTFTIFDRKYPIIAGITVSCPYIIYEGKDYREFTKNKEAFCGWLETNKLSDKYLIRNEYYNEELCVEDNWHTNTIEVMKDTVLEKTRNCIHIYMDRVHGDSIAFENFLSFIQKYDFDWIGLEMMDRKMQATIDEFIFSDENSSEYESSKDRLYEYYSSGWIKHFKHEYTSFEDNPFCQLMTLLRQKGIKVYAMEESNEMFLLFRNGETQFGGAVRSALWANHLPTNGRGLVFGGSAHFTSKKGINFQDFYNKRAPEQKLVICNYTH